MAKAMSTELQAIASALVSTFIAEIGDKTMISTMVFAMQTSRYVMVLLASIAGFSLANILPVVIAQFTGYILDVSIAKLVAGVLFIIAGLWMILEKEEGKSTLSKLGVLGCFQTILLLEMGDKTQIIVFSLALLYKQPWIVLIGGILGYALLNTISIVLARILRSKLEWSKIKKASGLIMIAIALWILIEYLLNTNIE